MDINVGEKIKNARQIKGLSQEELAQKASITVGYLSKLERWAETHRNPTLNTINSISKALNIPVNELLGLDPIINDAGTVLSVEMYFSKMLDYPIAELRRMDIKQIMEMYEEVNEEMEELAARASPDKVMRPKDAKTFLKYLERFQDFFEDIDDQMLGAFQIMASSAKLRKIPLLSGTVSAGEFRHAFNDWSGDMIDAPVDTPSNKVAWKVSGRSMEPAIFSGEVLIIDSSVRFSDGSLVVAENNNQEVTCKQLKLLKDGSIELRPLNPDYETMHILKTDDLNILGVVVGRYTDFTKTPWKGRT